MKSLENTKKDIPERFCGGDSLQRGAISSVCTFTLTTTSLLLLFFSRDHFRLSQDPKGLAKELLHDGDH